MGDKTRIEWTEATWNPVTGCSKVSEGCKHCYAEAMAKRLQAMGQANYADGFAVRCHEHMLDVPLRWRRARDIFVCSMSDLFHEEVPTAFIQRVLDVMEKCPRHTFQILTKRPERMAALPGPWPRNAWAGVTVENAKHTDRIDALRGTPGVQTRFVSAEPLLGPLPRLNLRGIDLVIVGGESGPRARPMQKEWVVDIRDQCVAADVHFFFKQWGGVNKKEAGCLLEGREWKQLPPMEIPF